MSADWDEIKKLAADFQKVQLTSNLQKLSERNCIEIVNLLIEKELVNVYYTIDGKEYITPDHLEKEILDELYVHDGRIDLDELSEILNVSFQKISTIANKIAAKDGSIHFVLGRLINEDYILRIAAEINEKLTRFGVMSIGDLTFMFDLPSDFLEHQVVGKHLGKIIRGRQDPSYPQRFFNQAYISRCKSKIRGALAALTRPTSVASITEEIHIPDKTFHSLIEEISPAGIVTSKLANAQYIPHIYTKMQTEWVNSFYKQNNFIEYDAVLKLGVSDPKKFIKKQFPNDDITFLGKCAVGSELIDLTLLSAINECNSTKSYIDLETILPSSISREDIEKLFMLLIKNGKIPNNFIYLEATRTVCTIEFINNLLQPCKDLAISNAKKSIENGTYQQYIVEKQLNNAKNIDQDSEYVDSKTEKREERRRKAATGKGGGGTQGRETKTKSTKKHQRGSGNKNIRGGDYDDDNYNKRLSKKNVKTLTLISFEDIDKIIYKQLKEEGPIKHLSGDIAIRYHESINELALTTAQTLFESTPQTNRRQTHAALQEKLNTLLVDIRLYEKGLKLLPSDVQSQLIKYLLKSLGTDICNEICFYVANESNLNYKTSSLTVEQRNKIVQECDPEYKSDLIELNKSLTKSSIEEFLLAVENALKCCSMIVKKIDKKKDRSLIMQHKDKLCQQIQETDDPALILHLAVLILFTNVTGSIIHASGKFVSQLLQFLQSNLNDEQNTILREYHDLVLKFLNAGSDTDDGKEVLEKLKTLQKTIRDFAIHYEKSGNTTKSGT